MSPKVIQVLRMSHKVISAEGLNNLNVYFLNNFDNFNNIFNICTKNHVMLNNLYY